MLDEFFSKAHEMYQNGEPGALFAQIIPTTDGLAFMHVDALDQDTTIEVQKAIGQRVGHRPNGSVRTTAVWVDPEEEDL